MEGFLSIKWDNAVEEDACFFASAQVFSKCSATYHQFHGLKQTAWMGDSCPPEAEIVLSDKWEPDKLKREYVGDDKATQLKIELPCRFRHTSVLDYKQQIDYMHMILRACKATMSGTSVDPVEKIKFQEMQVKLQEESCQFQLFAKEVAMANPAIYSYTSPSIEKYVAELWKNNLSTIDNYPTRYKPIGSVTLIAKENISNLEMTLDKTLLQIGRIPRQVFTSALTAKLKFPRQYGKLSNRFPANSPLREPVSRDQNVIDLCEKYGVDIAVSSGALRTLAGCIRPFYKQPWDIPFSVIKSQGEQGRTVIYIDKPLPPRTMSAVEKNAMFSSLSSKVLLADKKCPHCYIYPGTLKPNQVKNKKQKQQEQKMSVTESPEPEKPLQEIPETLLEITDCDKVEVPVCSPPKPVVESDVEKLARRVSDDSESDSNTSLVIDLGSPSNGQVPECRRTRSLTRSLRQESYSPKKTSSSPKKRSSSPKKTESSPKTEPANKTSISPYNLLNSILEEQSKMMEENCKKAQAISEARAAAAAATTAIENPHNYQPPKRGDNLSYRVWNMKVPGKQLHLLIRTSLDTAATNAGDSLSYMISTKLEYQPWYGAECLTLREAQQQWMDLRVRPGCKMFRVRVDAYTGHLLMSEQRDLSYFEADAGLHFGSQFDTKNVLENVWSVFSSLKDLNLKPGSYLLQHSEGIAVNVLEKFEGEESSTDVYDLKVCYDIDSNSTVELDVNDLWVPLDPWTVMPIQRILARPPLTFEPEGGKPANVKKAAQTKNKAKGKRKAPLKVEQHPKKLK